MPGGLYAPGVPGMYQLILGSHLTTRPTGSGGYGSTVTASATPNTYGSYVELIDGALVTDDVWAIRINCNNANVANNARQGLLTVGYDPTAGTSYTDYLTDIIVDRPAAYAEGGVAFWFPAFFPAGSSIAVKFANTTGSQTCSVAIWLFCKPRHPEMTKTAHLWRTFGVVTATSEGTVLTPGTASEGAWAEMGTVADDNLWFWNLGYTSSDSAYGTTSEHVDLAIGDATTKNLVIVDDAWFKSSSEYVKSRSNPMGGYWSAKNGDKVYIRSQSSGTVDTDTTAAAYAMGG